MQKMMKFAIKGAVFPVCIIFDKHVEGYGMQIMRLRKRTKVYGKKRRIK